MPVLDSDNKSMWADFPPLLGWQLQSKPYQLAFQDKMERVS